MKKYVIKATALAIGALVGGAAFASVNLDTGVTTGKFAKELDYSSTTAPAAAIVAGQTVTTKLGFGVSAAQNRYIRVDLTGAKLGAGAFTVTNATAFTNSVIVQGGASGDTYAIFQITSAGAGNLAGDVNTITLPALLVTNGNASNVGVTYALYETAVAAVNNVAGTSLYKASGDLLTFAAGLKWSLATNNTTASVEKSFKEFTAATTTGLVPATANVKTAKIGTFTFGTNTGVFDATGTQVTVAGLVSAQKAVIVGEFGAAVDNAATPPVYNIATSTDGCATTTALTLNAALTSATFTIPAPVAPATTVSRDVCYIVTGNTAVSAQTVTAALDITAVAGSSAADVAAATIGTIDRDGTELQAPFVTIHPDYLSRVVLTSQHSADAAVTFSAITEDGVTVPTINSAATLKAGKQLVVNVKDIVPSLSAGTRLAIKAIIAAPKSKIEGVYNVMNYDAVTGKTNSLISYQLARPAN